MFGKVEGDFDELGCVVCTAGPWAEAKQANLRG